jgi:hypothetical protein
MPAAMKTETSMRLLISLILCAAMPLQAQDSDADTVNAAAGCTASEYRQFDFWVGEWNVTANGQPAGVNSVRSIHQGCVLQENWQGSGAGGIRGSSFNVYDQARDKWHQTWVDDSGTLLQLDGGLQQGSMVLEGRRPSADGSGLTTHRISWTKNDDGSVRQLWDASRDGETWTVLFDGLYTRVAGS